MQRNSKVSIQVFPIPFAILLVMLLLYLNWAPFVFAQDSSLKDSLLGNEEIPWEITAGSLTYQKKESILAEGDVVIRKADQTLYAQRVLYNVATGIAKASGDVRFEFGKDILTGKEGTFDLKNQTGEISEARLFLAENHFYVSGEVAEKTGESNYIVKNCEITTCDGPKPDWSISAKEVKVNIEGYGTAKHAAFRVREIPVLYVPYMIFPGNTKRQSGLLLPRIGHSTLNGIDTELPFFWAISDQTDATFYQRYMSKRGYMQGVEFRYLLNEESKGALLFDILSDRKNKDLTDPDDVEISPFSRSNSTRYWLRGKVNQDLPLGITARLNGDYVSDQDYPREFEEGLYGFEARPDLMEEFGRPMEERRSPFRTSTARLSRDQDGYSLQAASSYYQQVGNPDLEDETLQPLGGLRFILLPDNIMKSPVFFSLNSDYDYVWREKGSKGHRASISPELTMPLWLGRYLEFETFLGYTYNLQWSEDDTESADRRTDTAYTVGGRLLTNLDRIYDTDWRNAKRLKHQIRPTLSYTYRNPQNEEDESPWFEPIDVEGKINRVDFSLVNYLDARLEKKRGDVEYRQWVTLTFSQGFDIEESRRDAESGKHRRPFEPFKASLRVQPFAGIDFVGNAEWDHYDHQITNADVSLELSIDRSGGRKDSIKFDYTLDENNQESLNYKIDVNLFHGFSAGTSLERNLKTGENISSSYWLGYDSQCWGAKIVAKVEDQDTSVTLLFNLLGLGDFKAM